MGAGRASGAEGRAAATVSDMTAATSATTGPGALDVLSLVAEVADELVVRTARDTHVAVLDRLDRVVGRTGLGRWHRTLATVAIDVASATLDVRADGPCGHRAHPASAATAGV